MPRYIVNIQTERPPDQAFAYMADLTNFATWDPGVRRATQVVGDGPDLGAAYDVTVASVGPPLTLRYHLIEVEAPSLVVARAASTLLTSLDRITVEPASGGSIVTYDARLTLNGPLGLFHPMLAIAFKQIGDRAAAGLIDALEGERVPAGRAAPEAGS